MKVESLLNVVNGPVVTPPNGNGNVPAVKKPANPPVSQELDGKEKYGVQPETNQEKLSKAVEVANNAFKEVNIGFRYSVDKKTNREVVTVINIETGEAIRQFPPEEIMNMLSRMYDMLGILIDKKI
mgnify:CR=1 FL=1